MEKGKQIKLLRELALYKGFQSRELRIVLLCMTESGLRATDIAELMRLDKSNISRMLSRLTSSGVLVKNTIKGAIVYSVNYKWTSDVLSGQVSIYGKG